MDNAGGHGTGNCIDECVAPPKEECNVTCSSARRPKTSQKIQISTCVLRGVHFYVISTMSRRYAGQSCLLLRNKKIVWPSNNRLHHGDFEAKYTTIKLLSTLKRYFRRILIHHCKIHRENTFDCWCRRPQSSERPNSGSILLYCIEHRQ